MTSTQSADTAAVPSPEKRPTGALKRVVYSLLVLLALVLAYLFVWPSAIDPVAYDPPPAMPLEGALAPNDQLAAADFLAVGQVPGPEDVEPDGQGRVFTGTEDGRVVRVDADGKLTTLANTGGRPTGITLAADGNLLVADSIKGLLSIDPDGKVTTLVDARGEFPLGFADDVTVAADGTIYFSDASDKFGHDEYLYDMLEARPHGRLLRYDPSTGKTTLLLDGLYFANGVALGPDEAFVLVNETYRFRVTRYWLKGDRAGKSDVFIENLPGFPDNITANPQGKFWLALFTVRNERADWLSPRPFFKKLLSKLPGFMWPRPAPYGFVVELDADGKVVRSLQDPSGKRLFAVTSAVERDGQLYLGSLLNDRIGKLKLDK